MARIHVPIKQRHYSPWFEEPVSSDDLDGLPLLRGRVPAPIQIAAGEYGYDPLYFRRMLHAQAVDARQADATRCCGITGFLKASALCDADPLSLSAHCASAMHMHPSCGARPVRRIEYLFDHVRTEQMLFDGVIEPTECCIRDRVPESAWNSNGKMLNGMRHEESWHNLLRRKN
jgi:L-alanine-DL-glutamate epimerase-like enolase superfamily enzyme